MRVENQQIEIIQNHRHPGILGWLNTIVSISEILESVPRNAQDISVPRFVIRTLKLRGHLRFPRLNVRSRNSGANGTTSYGKIEYLETRLYCPTLKTSHRVSDSWTLERIIRITIETVRKLEYPGRRIMRNNRWYKLLRSLLHGRTDSGTKTCVGWKTSAIGLTSNGLYRASIGREKISVTGSPTSAKRIRTPENREKKGRPRFRPSPCAHTQNRKRETTTDVRKLTLVRDFLEIIPFKRQKTKNRHGINNLYLFCFRIACHVLILQKINSPVTPHGRFFV